MNSFSSETPYYKIVGDVVCIFQGTIEEELGRDDYYKKKIEKRTYGDLKNENLQRAKYAHLYKEEFKRLCDIAIKEIRQSTSRRQQRKNALKLAVLHNICEVKFLRLLKQEGKELVGSVGGDEEDTELIKTYIKFYKKLEKTLRWIYVGEKEKALALKAKLNEVLVDVWSILSDRSKKGVFYSYYNPDTDKVLENGGAFAPILDSFKGDIEMIEVMISDM